MIPGSLLSSSVICLPNVNRTTTGAQHDQWDLFTQSRPDETDDPPELSESEVIAAVDREVRWSSDLLDTELSANREIAWQYFEGSRPGRLDDDIDEHFETIVSRDVADTIESTLAEIMPAFATERPAEFDPAGPGDEDNAVLESDMCNDVLMEAGLGYLELTTAAKNALLLRIGILEIIWDDQDDVSYTQAENVSPEQIAMLLSDPNVEIREIEKEAPIPGLLDVEIRKRTPRNKCRIEAVPVDELLISSDCTGLNLDTARFVGRQTLESRSDLVAQGIPRDVVDQLPAYTTTADLGSRRVRERNYWGREKKSGDRATDEIMVVRAYYKLDEDRDGIAELRRIVVAGKLGGWTMLEDEPADFQPFAAGAGYIWPHQPYGISLYDKLKQIQDLKTKFWRIQLEAGQRAARDRVGLLPGTNREEWMATQFGGAVRMTHPQGIVPIPNPTFPTQLAQLGEMADKARREGGGRGGGTSRTAKRCLSRLARTVSSAL